MASACLVGVHCRYDGTSKISEPLREAFIEGSLIPFCPEVLGGLGTPRPKMAIEGGDGYSVLDGVARAVNETGEDRTEAMLKGARASGDIAKAVQAEKIFLKSGSPSCGWGLHKGVEVIGVAAALLHRAGFSLERME